MPGIHKDKTLSFRPTEAQRQMIEARAKVSGMNKKDSIAKSCIYSKICVVESKAHIETLALAIQDLRYTLKDIASELTTGNFAASKDDFMEMKMEYMAMISALVELLDASAYLLDGISSANDNSDKQKEKILDLLNAIYVADTGTCHLNGEGVKKGTPN